MNQRPFLEVRNVSLSFSGLKALDDVSFDVAERSIVGLIGPNGAGKSTLLNCLSGIYRPTDGAVSLQGIDLLSVPVHGLAPLGVARTFQNLELFSDATVAENILTGALHQWRSNVLADIFRLPYAVRRAARANEIAARLANDLALSDVMGLRAGSLPFGIQKNVELARALAADPRLLFLDEPAAGLNPEESRCLGDTIRNLRDVRGLTIIMVEHDMRLIMETCDVVIVLVQGQKICEGSPDAVRSNPKVIEVYLGEDDEVASDPRDELGVSYA